MNESEWKEANQAVTNKSEIFVEVISYFYYDVIVKNA